MPSGPSLVKNGIPSSSTGVGDFSDARGCGFIDRFARVIGVSSVALEARGATAADFNISPLGALVGEKLSARPALNGISITPDFGALGFSVAINSTVVSSA